MNYGEIVRQLYSISGRTDLIDQQTMTDIGIGYYVNAGQRWLDTRFFGKHMLGRYFHTYPAGTYTISIPACRTIKEVWAYDTEKRWKLDKKTLEWMRENYPLDWRTIERSIPLYYVPTVLRLYPTTTEQTLGEADFAGNQANVIADSPFAYDGILVLPPNEAQISFEVWGLFHSNPLIESDDISWWSVRYPDILIKAALREIEIAHRNTQGVNDWEAAINNVMVGLIHDGVEEETEDIDQMEG